MYLATAPNQKPIPNQTHKPRGFERSQSVAEAACAEVVRVADAAKGDCLDCLAIFDAAQIREEDAERAAHKVFKKYGLSLDVNISWAHIPVASSTCKVPYLKPSEYLSCLLKEHDDLLWAGGDPEARCEAFWRAYFQFQPSHQAFQQFSKDQLKHVLPLMIHGDEGTGSKKQPVSIVSFQTPWGTPTDARKFAKRKHLYSCSQCAAGPWKPCCSAPPSSANASAEQAEDMRLRPQDLEELEKQWPTVSGNSYASRHLCFILPTYMVNKGPEVLHGMLEAISTDISNLFFQGLEMNSVRYFAALLGCKGDSKWHVQTGNIERSYQHLGSVEDYQICAWCDAGHANHPFEDCSDTASWVSTLFQSVPWSDPGPFEGIPFDLAMPAAKYRRDPLHIFKIGLARDMIGSLIMLLARFYRVWDWPGDLVGLKPRMERAHKRFSLRCNAEHETPHFRSFTKDFLHMKSVKDYAYTGSKGSDSMLLLRWLQFELGLAIEQGSHGQRDDLLRVGLRMAVAARDCFRLLYSHGLWLGVNCMKALRHTLLTMTRGYSYMAKACVELNFPAFALKTTLHGWHHMAVEIDHCLQRCCTVFPNPILWGCSQDEDFVGRTARVSRSTHVCTSSLRCVQRHLLKVKAIILKEKGGKRCAKRRPR